MVYLDDLLAKSGIDHHQVVTQTIIIHLPRTIELLTTASLVG